MRICFWNIDKKASPEIIANLAAELDIDVIVLAECRNEDGQDISELVLSAIQSVHRGNYRLVETQCESIRLFTSLGKKEMTPKIDTKERWVTFAVRAENYVPFFLTCCHHHSQQGASPAKIAYECQEMLTDIREAEEDKEEGIDRRTIVIGDFNLQPWDQGIAGVMHLNAVMTKSLAVKETRIYDRRRYAYFYNPMWGHFGDTAGDPPASYYDRRNEPDKTHWNMLDQILIRPLMIPHFNEGQLRIIAGLKQRSFLRKDRPDREAISAHLPVYFEILQTGIKEMRNA